MARLYGNIDLHIHTVFSDGTNSPEEIVSLVKSAGIKTFSITDHDTALSAEALKGDLDGLKFISGIEFSCKDDEGKYHILGYGFNPNCEEFKGVVKRGHTLRIEKTAKRIEFLNKEFGFEFEKEEVDRLLSLNNPGKPHIANLMVKYGYAKTKEDAIEKFIDKVRFKNEYLTPKEAIKGIIEGGGVAVLAHPFYGSGNELILGNDMDSRLKTLKGYGLKGLEAYYSGFTDKMREDALFLAEKHDLLITAGSDYHGGNKLVRLGDTGLSENELPERLIKFLETF